MFDFYHNTRLRNVEPQVSPKVVPKKKKNASEKLNYHYINDFKLSCNLIIVYYFIW